VSDFTTRSWAMVVKVDDIWAGNSCRYASEAEAKNAGRELLSRWSVPTDYRADRSPDAVNHVFDFGKDRSVRIDTEMQDAKAEVAK